MLQDYLSNSKDEFQMMQITSYLTLFSRLYLKFRASNGGVIIRYWRKKYRRVTNVVIVLHG
jgi:hypothetical protein